jgi:peptidyl-prolyl cis-trans isomerase C
MSMRKAILLGLGGVAVLAFGAGRLPAQAPAAPAKPAAIVNGEAIPQTELAAVLSQQPPPPNPLTDAQKKELARAALDMLVDDLLMRQYLRKNAPAVAPAEVAKQIQELKDSLTKRKQKLEDFLKESGQTEEQVRLEIVARLQWSAFAKARLGDDVIKKYYDENKTFFDKVAVRASHILLRVAPTAKAEDRQKAQTTLLTLRQEIMAGKLDFAEAAKKYSECPSKVNGGDIGFFPYKFVVLEPFAKAAFAMKVGEVSGVVQTDYGMHLIKVTDRNNGEQSNFDRIKEEVREIAAQEMQANLLEAQRKAAKIEINVP